MWNEPLTMSTKNECGNEVAESEYDLINKPRHYNRENAMECIDEMELIFGPEATAHFCLLNCWKYRYRAGAKDNGYQDLEKSDWYMNKYKELKEKCKPSIDTITLPHFPSDNPWIVNPTVPYCGTSNPTVTYSSTNNNVKEARWNER